MGEDTIQILISILVVFGVFSSWSQTSITSADNYILEGSAKYRPHFSIDLSYSWGEMEDARNFDGFLGYFSYQQFVRKEGRWDAFSSIPNLKDLEKNYLAEVDNDDWGELSLVERSEALGSYATHISGYQVDPNVILAEYAIQYAIQNPSDWQKGFNELGQQSTLSLENKVLIASQLGGQFLEKYNRDRADNGAGIVGVEELFNSLKEGTPGGVCRDISKSQGLILEAMGVDPDRMYIMAYKSLNGGHAVLAVQDEENPQKIVKINYNYITDTEAASDESALVQESPGLNDIGTTVRLYDITGKPIGKMPTEVGSVLQNVFDTRFNYFPINNSNINKLVGESRFGNTLVFSAETPNGDQMFGIGHTIFFDMGEKTRFSFSLGYFEREGVRPQVSLDQKAIYMNLDADHRLFDYALGSKGNIYGGVALTIQALYSKNKLRFVNGASAEGTTTEIYGFLTGYLGGSYQLGERVGIQGEVGFVGSLDFKDVGAGSSGGYTLSGDWIYTSGQLDWDLGLLQADTKVGLILRDIGSTGYVEQGLSHKNYRGYIGFQGRLTGDVPNFVPGSAKQVFGGLQVAKGRGFGSVTLSKNLDNGNHKANIEFRIPLGGKKRR